MKPRFACLADWLRWQEQLHPSAIELGLERIRPVAQALLGPGLTERKPFTFTVAGTNGKGSCVTTLGQMLTASGRKTGTFTSPHLLHYNERIRIDGECASDEALCDAFAAIDAARGETSLTYFEFNTLAALWLFQQAGVEIQVLEVGLGGRLDAVNLVDADLAIITNIALDHTDWLGDTREQIGVEKAGILRPGGKLIYGEADMPSSVQALLASQSVACRQFGRDFQASPNGQEVSWTLAGPDGAGLQFTSPAPALPWPSVACALQALAWTGLGDVALFERVLPALQLAGRFEQRRIGGRQVVLDVAHNPAGARYLCQRLQQAGQAPADILFAVMADKDIPGIVAALQPAIADWTLLSLDDLPRAATMTQMTRYLLDQGIPATSIHAGGGVATALPAALARHPERPLLVAGSFFTVAAVLAALPDAG